MRRLLSVVILCFTVAFLFSCAKEVPITIDENIGQVETTITIEKEQEKQEKSEEKAEEKPSEAVKLAKAFYEEYFAQEDENEKAEGRMGNAERLEVVKRLYLTDSLIEELHLRSRQDNCDAITNSQDDKVIRDKLIFTNGKDENTADVIYREEYENGGFYQDIIELHFIDTDEGKRADALNVYHEDKDASGNGLKYERITKYATHGDFTEEDKKEMESIKKSLDDLEAQGFIG